MRSLRPADEHPTEDAPPAVTCLSPEGEVARFIFQQRDIYSAKNTPKPSAFAPERHPELQRFETSVCGVEGVSSDRLNYLSANIRAGKQAVALSKVGVQGIAACNLQCEHAPDLAINFHEHCVIIGWDDGEDKSLRIAAQQELAAIASPVIRLPA